jgi:hypothetical protein
MTHSQGKEDYISVISIFICYQYLWVALELHYFPTMPKYPLAPKLSCYPRSRLHTEIPVHIHNRKLYSSRHLYMNRVKNKQVTYSYRINMQLLINHKMGARTTHFSGPIYRILKYHYKYRQGKSSHGKKRLIFLYPTDNCHNSYTFPLTNYSTSASYLECVQSCKCYRKLLQKMSCNNLSTTDK